MSVAKLPPLTLLPLLKEGPEQTSSICPCEMPHQITHKRLPTLFIDDPLSPLVPPLLLQRLSFKHAPFHHFILLFSSPRSLSSFACGAFVPQNFAMPFRLLFLLQPSGSATFRYTSAPTLPKLDANIIPESHQHLANGYRVKLQTVH